MLIVNGRLLVGATLKEVNNTIDEATNPLQFIIAREVRTYMCAWNEGFSCTQFVQWL